MTVVLLLVPQIVIEVECRIVIILLRVFFTCLFSLFIFFFFACLLLAIVILAVRELIIVIHVIVVFKVLAILLILLIVPVAIHRVGGHILVRRSQGLPSVRLDEADGRVLILQHVVRTASN